MKSFYIKLLSILAIIGLGIIVYSNSFLCSFHFDDDAYIVNNFAIRNIKNLADIWNICPCRFITFLSIALNYHFHRLDLFGYHLFNLVIHLASACFVWWLVLLTFSTPVMKEEKISRHANIIALFAGLIFVSHPLQTEAVTYIWQRAASMSAFFYLASLSFYVKSRLLDSSWQEEPTIGPGALYYTLSLLTAVGAMFTKENAITLPLMILFYEFSFIRDKKGFNWLQLFPFLLTMAIIPKTIVLTLSARFQEIQSIVQGPGGISPLDYLLTQFRVMITYIRLLFLPLHLNLDYDYPVYKSLFQIPVLLSLLSLSAILYFAKRTFSKYRILSFSIIWFFLTLLPESSILPQADVIFEHRLYLPMVGFCLFLASGIFYLCHCEPRRGEAIFTRTTKFLILILSFFIVFNSILTFQRNKIWINETVLWNDIVQKSSHKARPYINRGWAFYNQGDFTDAMSDFNKAIEISPELIYSYDDRGLIYARQGDLHKAISEYDKAIKINPYFAKVFYDRGHAFLELNNYSQALSDYNKAIELFAEYIDAYNDRGKLYETQGKWAHAESDYKRSIKIDPDQSGVEARLREISNKI